MDFEAIFSLKGKELARYRFPVEIPADIAAGVSYAIETFRVDNAEIDLLGDGMLMQIQRAEEDDGA
jgi:hypothetical protein